MIYFLKFLGHSDMMGRKLGLTQPHKVAYVSFGGGKGWNGRFRIIILRINLYKPFLGYFEFRTPWRTGTTIFSFIFNRPHPYRSSTQKLTLTFATENAIP